MASRLPAAVYSRKQVQQAQRVLFEKFLCSLLDSPGPLQAHLSNNAQIPWFHKRINLKLDECIIVSTTWLFHGFCAWHQALERFPEGSVEEACATQYSSPSGQQKSFTLFIRQHLLKKIRRTQRLKGQDTPEGNSEYFLVIPGGLDTLTEALRNVPPPGAEISLR